MEKQLEAAQQDYHRFSCLFLSLGLFLTLGFLLPPGYRIDVKAQPMYVLIVIVTFMVAAIFCWLSVRAKRAREQMNE
ncbi:YrhC family protein [Bacillus sp. FSL W7-1360]